VGEGSGTNQMTGGKQDGKNEIMKAIWSTVETMEETFDKWPVGKDGYVRLGVYKALRLTAEILLDATNESHRTFIRLLEDREAEEICHLADTVEAGPPF
jgi:hypothetical protein